MRALTAEDVLRVWERAQGQSTTVAALLALSAGLPEESWEALAALPLGERDALLLRQREATFGPELDSRVECPECGEALEFAVRSDQLAPTDAPSVEPRAHFERENVTVTLRPLDSADLLALETSVLGGDAAHALARRALIEARRSDTVVDFDGLNPDEHAWLEDCLTEVDPRAEILLQMRCPDCSHAWGAPFDVAAYVLAEVQFEAERVLAQVHTLARYYGWREHDILTMSAHRRRAYLERVGS